MKTRLYPDKSANMVGRSGIEWSCPYFDGGSCELIMVSKQHLTSCRGIWFNCSKQIIRHRRDRQPRI